MRDNPLEMQKLPSYSDTEKIFKDSVSLYTSVGFYMLRAPVLSVDTFWRIAVPLQERELQLEDLESGLAALRRQSHQVLRQLATDPLIEQALYVASSDIFEGLTRMQKGEASQRRRQRVYASLLRYLVRMSTRPTPFGLFAGIAIGSLGNSTTACIGTPAIERIRTRPDMGWLLSLVQKIETDEALIPLLQVVANRMVYAAGARYILPHADVYGQGDNRSIAIRKTAAVQYVLEKASSPILYSDLRRDLLTTFPKATESQIDSLLRQLWENHFLISDLRPPLTSADPESYLLEGLSRIPETASLRNALDDVIKQTEEIDQRGIGSSAAEFHTLKKQQMKLLPDYKEHYYQLDASLHLERDQMNKEVGEAVADAASALLRTALFPQGPHHLQEYRYAFLERYGSDAEVPLLDLLSPETGLDAPTGYFEPARTYPLTPLPRPSTEQREHILSMLLIEALHQGAQEVELTDDLLTQLAQWTTQSKGVLPPALEMYLQIQASSREAIDRGEWRGVISPMGLSDGGRTFCRFFDIMGKTGLEQLQAYARCEEAFSSEAIFAELSFLPIFARGANVAIRPQLRSYEIVVNTTPSVPPERVIELQDLVVGVHNERFYVRSVRLNKEIIVTQSHMLNPMRAPNVCRFLLEVSHDGQPGPLGFDWGVMSNAPFLPRVVRKKIVVSPAQWNVHRSTIKSIGPGSEEACFYRGVQQWRAKWRVPRYVYLTYFDDRLLLDLEHPLFVEELYHELKTLDEQRQLVLQEMLPDFAHLWLKDERETRYVSELVIPLLLRDQANKAEQSEALTQATRQEQKGRNPIWGKERRKLPGNDWTFLKLYSVPKQFDEIITRALREVVRNLYEKRLIDRWFFLRYSDPAPHLRVRFHVADPHDKDTLLTTALDWSNEVAAYGLIHNIVVDSYDREIERYGGPEALDMLEQVFTANSAALSEIIAAIYQQQITLDPLAIAVWTLDHFFEMWCLSFSQRMEFAQKLAGNSDAREAFRSQRKLLCELLAPWDPDFDPSVGEQREVLRRLSSPQAATLSQASAHLQRLAAHDELWGTELNILSSLAHMHVNRLLGPDREQETRIYVFWKYTLESLQRRPASKEKRRKKGKHSKQEEERP